MPKLPPLEKKEREGRRGNGEKNPSFKSKVGGKVGSGRQEMEKNGDKQIPGYVHINKYIERHIYT